MDNTQLPDEEPGAMSAPEAVDYGWEQSAEVSEVMDAFAKAQANFTDPVKDTKGQYGKHATMAGVYDSIRKALNDAGIAVIVAKTADHASSMVSVSVRFYKGAQFIGVHASTPIVTDRQTYIWAQASGWTYLERYLTSGLAGVAPDEDDDGAVAANEANPDHGEVQKGAQQRKQSADNWQAQQINSTKKPSETPTVREGNILRATVTKINSGRTKTGKEYRSISIADPIAVAGAPKPFDLIWCWHQSMWEDLKQMPGRECEFMVAVSEKGITLNSILRIGSIEWTEPQTASEPPQEGSAA